MHRITTASQSSLSHASIHESGQKTAAINFQTKTSIIVGLLKLLYPRHTRIYEISANA